MKFIMRVVGNIETLDSTHFLNSCFSGKLENIPTCRFFNHAFQIKLYKTDIQPL